MALKSLGVEAGERVAIFSNTRVEWAFADMAILGIGGVTVPIYQSSIPTEIEFILNNSEATVLFVENQALLEKWKSIAEKTPSVKWVISFEVTNSNDERLLQLGRIYEMGERQLSENPDGFIESCENRSIEELATIVYTSGTTGVPKGVQLTHQQIMSEIADVFTILDVSEKDSSLTFLPFAHIFGRVEHWGHVHVGWMMGYAESIDRIKNGLLEIKPTFLVAVPRIFEKVYNGIVSKAEAQKSKKKIFQWALKIGLEVSDAKCSKRSIPLPTLVQYQLARKLVYDKLIEGLGGRLRFAFSGGAPLSKEIARFFHAANIYILEGYGLTETTAGAYVNSMYDYKFGTVGKAIGDVETRLADDGEILIRSKKVMTGYYKNESATNEVLSKDGWFATGDIGELSPDGFLRITDRKKDLIKTAGGKFVAPQKLENLLKLNKYISNVLIHGDKRKFVIALVTLNFDEINRLAAENGITTRDHAQLIRQNVVKEVIRQAVADMNSQLASYESVKAFEILPEDFTIESGELTPSLKVRRKFCDKKYAALIDKLYGGDTGPEMSSAH
jgi:long-chain acyl-CoA synthetase